VVYLLATPATGHRRYPPRAVTRPADQDVTPEQHADDVHRLCSAAAPDPGDLHVAAQPSGPAGNDADSAFGSWLAAQRPGNLVTLCDGHRTVFVTATGENPDGANNGVVLHR
jgi:hypothetical protein